MIDEPKNVIELTIHPDEREYSIGVSFSAPKSKTLSKEQLIEYINSLPDQFVFIQWDYPHNDRYKMIEALFDGSIENEIR